MGKAVSARERRRRRLIRAASACVALLLGVGFLITERSEDYGIPFPIMVALWAIGLSVLFFMAWAADDVADENLFKLLPLGLFLPAVPWLLLFLTGKAGENSILDWDLGRWRVFGVERTTTGLYGLLLCAALAYNMARVTLSRIFPAD